MLDEKIMYSIWAAILFAVIASPFLYNIVNMVLGFIVPIAVNGCPTFAGVIVHAVVFGLITYLLMVFVKPAAGAVPPPMVEEMAKRM